MAFSTNQPVKSSVPASKQQLDQARGDYANGKICTEDYIYKAMQCYAADIRDGLLLPRSVS